jgi:hypothetical protein
MKNLLCLTALLSASQEEFDSIHWQFQSMAVVFDLFLRTLAASIKLVSLHVHVNTVLEKKDISANIRARKWSVYEHSNSRKLVMVD